MTQKGVAGRWERPPGKTVLCGTETGVIHAAASPARLPRPRRAWFLGVMVVGSALLAVLAPDSTPAAASWQESSAGSTRVRARELGIVVGVFQPGPHNAITDVDGVQVGHATVWEGDRIRTGVTAIRPHPGNVYRDRVPASIHVGNGFGKLVGVTQVMELGELETPILLTCTLCVWRVADAMVEWALAMDGMEQVRSINPVVGETNDGVLNDIRARPVTAAHVVDALESAAGGRVEEGSVGAGTGVSAFGWKGGIGTSSRELPASLGGYRVGVLVQSNFGGILSIAGAPVGRELGRYAFQEHVERGGPPGGAAGRAEVGEGPSPESQGSIMIVVATDAPLSSRNLGRMARRAMMGLSRTGSFASNGSGDYVIGFSTARSVRRRAGEEVQLVEDLANPRMSAIFQATVEATEEAIYNSMFMAVGVSSSMGRREALPIEETVEVLRRYGAIRR